jgi:hemerythrin-like domain-containing protein
MLTSTYTLVTLSVEQNTVRGALQSLVEDLHALPGDLTTLALGRAAQLCASLRQTYDSCHWRKLDKFLVPALRRHTAAADGLLGELDQLSRNAAEAIYVAEACVAQPDRPVPRERFSSAVERCVAALRLRLEREEHELFPLARSVVGDSAWFAIANQMLAHDAYARERRDTPVQRATAVRALAADAANAAAPGLYGMEAPGHGAGRHGARLSLAH